MDTAIIKYRFIMDGEFSLEVNEGDQSWNPVYKGFNFRELVRAMANLTDEGEELTVEQRVHALGNLPSGIIELLLKNLHETEKTDSHRVETNRHLSLNSKLKIYQALERTRAAIWLIERALE